MGNLRSTLKRMCGNKVYPAPSSIRLSISYFLDDHEIKRGRSFYENFTRSLTNFSHFPAIPIAA
jgi:hypothetical protein